MANIQSISSSFKTELMNSFHSFGVSNTRGSSVADTFKAALFLSSATLNAATTAYSTTGEVIGTGYTAGGVIAASSAPALDGTTAHWTPAANFSWTTVTLSTPFDAVQIYNSSQANRSVGVYTFGSQMVTAGNFTLTMPVDDGTTGLLRLE